ncbi:hypothetical protein DFJ74DRAFT_652217 [Hyaloraphidium curvatum]|nr:hypothetical protein DFJ74DRAFT_652217 [Hyaloraphidium curvatum]
MSVPPRLIAPPPVDGREADYGPDERGELLMHVSSTLALQRTELSSWYTEDDEPRPPGLLFEALGSSSTQDPPCVKDFDAFAKRTVGAICDGVGADSTERRRALDSVIRFQPFDVSGGSVLRPLDEAHKKHLLSSVLLVLLLTGRYDARARVMLRRLAAAIGSDQGIDAAERSVAAALVDNSRLGDPEAAKAPLAEMARKNKLARVFGVGAATVAGGLLIGLTGGLAAPLIGAGLAAAAGAIGLGGTALAAGIAAVAGNAALIGSIFGSYGAAVSSEAVANRMKDVEDFAIVDLSGAKPGESNKDEEERPAARALHATICVSGWLMEPGDAVDPWRVLGDTEGDVFALRWEEKALMDVGAGLAGIVKRLGGRMVVTQVLQQTALATLTMALWPLALLNAGSLIDNPWLNGMSLAEKAGKVLAEVLLARAQGQRPVSLVGASLGATVVFECLLELDRRGGFGIVENAFLLGAPVSSAPERWMRARRVVAGRMVNAYSKNDWVLAFCYRTLNFKLGVAGLGPVAGVEGVENVDLSADVTAHTVYRFPGLLLRQCGFGSLVEDEVQHQKLEAKEEMEAEEALRIQELELEGTLEGDVAYSNLQRPNPGEPLPPWMEEPGSRRNSFNLDDPWLSPHITPVTPNSGNSEVVFEAGDDAFGETSPIELFPPPPPYSEVPNGEVQLRTPDSSAAKGAKEDIGQASR